MGKFGVRAPGPIRFRTGFRNTIYDVLLARGWQEVGGQDDPVWDFNWCDPSWMHNNFDGAVLAEYQKVNHFRNHYELTQKACLLKNLKRAQKQLRKEGKEEEAAKYDFHPTSYLLPQEWGLFIEEFKRSGVAANLAAKKGAKEAAAAAAAAGSTEKVEDEVGDQLNVWIMKPTGSAQGKGIFLCTKLQQVQDWRKGANWRPSHMTTSLGGGDGKGKEGEEEGRVENYVAQRYIENPMLIGGRKFDLRIYVLVLSYNPLRVYVNRSGFARFSMSRFTMNKDQVGNNLIHLTNVAIQKKGPQYSKNVGMKWPLNNLKVHCQAKYGAAKADELFADIEGVIIRSLMAVQPIIINDKHSFEMYGYDVLIDSNLKPWLVEVNASPSLSADTKADYENKCEVLSDMLDVVDMEGRFGGQLPEQVGGFDLIWDGGPVDRGRKSSLPTLLGCANDRDKQLRRLATAAAPPARAAA